VAFQGITACGLARWLHCGCCLARSAHFFAGASPARGGDATTALDHVQLAGVPQLDAPPPTRRVAWGANVADLSNAYLLHDLGFTWVKGFADWNRVEPEQGTFFWEDVENTVEAAERAGLHLLLRVHNTPPWARLPETPPKRHAHSGIRNLERTEPGV